MGIDPTAPNSDPVVRALTNDGAFRVIAVETTATARRVAAVQGAKGTTARFLGEMVTAAVLVRETMAPDLRVQVILKGSEGKGSLVADSHPKGMTRGLVSLPQDMGDFSLSEDSVLQVVRTMPHGQLQQGVVPAPQASGISGGLMQYMQRSEQVVSVVRVACFQRGDEIVSAGGYVVQLLPEVEVEPLQGMIARLEGYDHWGQVAGGCGAEPQVTLSALLADVPYTVVETGEIHFGCNCSAVRVIGALASLPRDDIESLIESDKVIEMACDYCTTEYQVSPGQLRGLLDGS